MSLNQWIRCCVLVSSWVPILTFGYFDESASPSGVLSTHHRHASFKVEQDNKSRRVNHTATTQDSKLAHHPITTTKASHVGPKFIPYFDRLPQRITAPGEKLIVVDPKLHVIGAYTADGLLVFAGIATAGASWCKDVNRPCRTKVGTFKINSLGSKQCVSSKYPMGHGGAPMPYCMYFNGSQGLHGSRETAEANLSHGCVRMKVADAEWIRYNFATIGTKVIVKPY